MSLGFSIIVFVLLIYALQIGPFNKYFKAKRKKTKRHEVMDY
jgi:hypothetical protein